MAEIEIPNRFVRSQDDNPINLQIVQGNEKDWLFEQRESQKVHTAYEWEHGLFCCIRDGDVERLGQVLGHFSSNPVMVGKLSKNSLRQMQYLAVAFVTLATRYAIQGGMLEMDAYNRSDASIQKVDQLETVEKVTEFIIEFLQTMTRAMYDLKNKKNCSKPIRNCLEYINNNLHAKISLEELSKVANLCPQYLSALFKKEMGENIKEYVIKQKINTAKYMLIHDGFSTKAVSNYLDFSSQSHFINSFKKHSGMTPFEYQKYQKEY